MANPNIVNVTSIYGNTSYLIPSSTAAATWTALTPASNTVNKIDNIVAANVTSSSATVTVAINSAAAGAGTNYRLVYQVPVPVNASIVIVDKSTAFYLGEAQSIVITVGTASAIELTASYEAIT
jgi:predicted permease